MTENLKTMQKVSFFLIILTVFFTACTDFTTDKEIMADLKADVAYLADDKLEGRAIGTEGERLASEYIAAAFERIGLESKGTEGYFQPFTVKKSTSPHEKAVVGTDGVGVTGRNVAGFIDNGAEHTVVIGAHYDHLGYGSEGSLHRGEKAIHNGADDNASGTAVVIQMARILKENSDNFNYLFLAFSGEENGLWGSNYFSKNATVDISTVNYMINLDMVGRLNEERALAVGGVGTSPVWMKKLEVANTDSLKLVTTESGIGPSDHTSFYLQDLPVLHLFTGQHEDYHRPGDDADKINYQGMVEIVRFLERLVGELDVEEKLAFTKTKEDSGSSPRFSVSLGVVPDYLFDGEGMRIDGITEGKPAQTAGLAKGDVVVKLGDSTVVDMMSYMRALSTYKSGDQAVVEYKRGEELKAVEIKF